MKVKSNVKAAGGGIFPNHNEGLKVRSNVKAGGIFPNHNEGLKVRSDVKAGGIGTNHNLTRRG